LGFLAAAADGAAFFAEEARLFGGPMERRVMPRRRPNARARDASMSEIDDPGRLHHHLFQRTLIFSRERRVTTTA
jgi:hypothetical protein